MSVNRPEGDDGTGRASVTRARRLRERRGLPLDEDDTHPYPVVDPAPGRS